MDSHIVGNPHPQPFPQDGGREQVAEGNSIAVVQFVELIRGERTRQEPVNRGVVELRCEQAYCLSCYGVHPHDVARDVGGRLVMYRCRFCGKEGGLSNAGY